MYWSRKRPPTQFNAVTHLCTGCRAADDTADRQKTGGLNCIASGVLILNHYTSTVQLVWTELLALVVFISRLIWSLCLLCPISSCKVVNVTRSYISLTQCAVSNGKPGPGGRAGGVVGDNTVMKLFILCTVTVQWTLTALYCIHYTAIITTTFPSDLATSTVTDSKWWSPEMYYLTIIKSSSNDTTGIR